MKQILSGSKGVAKEQERNRTFVGVGYCMAKKKIKCVSHKKRDEELRLRERGC